MDTTDRETDRQTDRLTDWQTDRQTDWLTDWLTDRQTDWLPDRQTDRQAGRQTDWQTATLNYEISAVWQTKPRTVPQKTFLLLMWPEQVTGPNHCMLYDDDDDDERVLWPVRTGPPSQKWGRVCLLFCTPVFVGFKYLHTNVSPLDCAVVCTLELWRMYNIGRASASTELVQQLCINLLSFCCTDIVQLKLTWRIL